MKVKRVVERNLELRETIVKNENPFNPGWTTLRRERFKSTFEDKRLKEGGCHETIYKSGIIEIPDTAKTESRERRSVLDVKSVKKGFIPES